MWNVEIFWFKSFVNNVNFAFNVEINELILRANRFASLSPSSNKHDNATFNL